MCISSRLAQLGLAAALVLSLPTQAFEHFISRQGHQLWEGDQPFRFAGIQFPELHRIEDDSRGVCTADPRGWGQFFKWPSADEQENWIKSLTQTGHKAMRVYVLSVEQEFDHACNRQTHIMKPARANEMPRLNPLAMEHYDRMIALSDKYGLRLILPVVDHWPWWGGREQLAAFYGEQPEDFYRTDSKTFKAYLSIIEQLLTRKNTITGREYRQEKAIMAWETGNELLDTNAEFLRATAAHIKALDRNHLVIDGTYTKVNDFALDDPNVDIISNHYYQNVGNLSPATVAADLHKIQGKKAYLLGEFGLLDAAKLTDIMDAAITTQVNGAQTVGAFIWGGRGHRHDGGFYWHLEPANNKTYSYHLPGFAEGDANEEQQVIDMVRLAIARMEGAQRMKPLPLPEAPLLRTIFSRDHIHWLGSPTGRHYRVERANSPSGPWKTIGNNISDGKNRFDPASDRLFADKEPLESGREVFYRVIAINETGQSGPSNIRSFTP